ncbi:hypothetical protein [Microbacterium lacticum]|nr:hypothetical protein MLA01_23750 [Microbacterium lacticum]GGN16816.1 hypothetical protein GCM10009724_08270 [Microbacterium lacticum]
MTRRRGSGCRLRRALAGAREAFYGELDTVSIAELVNPRQVGPIAVQLGLRPPEQPDSGTPTSAI